MRLESARPSDSRPLSPSRVMRHNASLKSTSLNQVWTCPALHQLSPLWVCFFSLCPSLVVPPVILAGMERLFMELPSFKPAEGILDDALAEFDFDQVKKKNLSFFFIIMIDLLFVCC